MRVYRVLVPAALLVFVVLVVRGLQSHDRANTRSVGEGPTPRSMARGVHAVDMDGERKRMEIDAGVLEEDAHGRIRLEDIRQVKLFREALGPLVLSAASGAISGAKGARTMTFEREVSLTDPERGLTLRIPALEIDEAAAEARSRAPVVIEGATLRGHAERIVYGLRGQPATLEGVEFEDLTSAGRLVATRATLHDGVRDAEFLDGVELTRGVERFAARTLRVVRRADGTAESASASGPLSGQVAGGPGALVTLAADGLEAAFDEAGQARDVELRGGAALRRASNALAAERITAHRVGSAEGWRVEADGDVSLEAPAEGGAGLLRAERVRASFDAALRLTEATATGRVTIDAPTSRAEAAWASYSAAGSGDLRLSGSARRKARIVRERVRVAAEEIATDARGTQLVARTGVEATLLPPAAGRGGAKGLLDTGAAIQFVAAELTVRDSGARLVFSGQARGWQGDRNLAAERITLDQPAERMLAEGGVTARLPRRAGAGAAREGDYVQIVAERLEYGRGSALFQGEVRVLVIEGWIEAGAVEVALSPQDGEVDEIRAHGAVRIELRGPETGGAPKLAEGQSDRLVYRPGQATIWLIGDRAPALVRRVGADGGTTTGRVLRYQVELGTLEVDSGDGAPARIRTSG